MAGARKLVRAEGDRVVRSGADLGANDWHWLPLLWGNGGEFAKDGKIIQNSPEGVETLQFLADLVTRHRVMGRPAPAGGFNGGNAGISIFGSWNIKAKRQQPGLEFATAPHPRPQRRPGAPPGADGGHMAFSHKEKNDATWRFLSYLSRPEVAVEYAVGHGYQMPARHLGAEGQGLLRADRGRAGAEGAGRGHGSARRPADAPGAGLGADQGAGGQDAGRGPGRAAQRPEEVLDDYTRQFQVLAGQ